MTHKRPQNQFNRSSLVALKTLLDVAGVADAV